MWCSVLASCQNTGKSELGQQAFQLDDKDPSTYIVMSNLYADELTKLQLEDWDHNCWTVRIDHGPHNLALLGGLIFFTTCFPLGHANFLRG